MVATGNTPAEQVHDSPTRLICSPLDCDHWSMDYTGANAAQALSDTDAFREAQRQRAIALLDKLKYEGSVLENWHSDLLNHLAGELGFGHLRMAFLPHDWQSVPVIAFGARGLLELWVWAAYCTASTEHARKFYDDKFRDGMDFYDALERLLSLFSDCPNLAEQIEQAKANMDSLAASVGSDAPTEMYTQVAEAAKAVGLADFYRNANKLLSKLAHPSAMMVLNYVTPAVQSSLHDIAIFAKFIGFLAEAEAWQTIANYLERSLPVAGGAAGA